ncbi:hypothetical protein B5M42_003395 [Paenibacillus athensensis]|uniref:Uncharacterized protein n=1 Tax=Paenibacillus athensensis TaxID=1967502 RepID=A0A4Y8PWZ9_9BACL|nr:hypothetical protein [Paenibacillus athensensis]MCD1257885.1 hypothetical protein [Paenibacillus athensensis]
MSKKLQGNGLWESSKMMLHEHKAALLERQLPDHEHGIRAHLPTQEDLRLVRSCVLLPMMIGIVESNGRGMESSSYPLKTLYINATQILLNRLYDELAQVKRTLKERHIHIREEEHLDGAIHYRLVCRGYEDRLTLLRDIARAEIGARIGQHIHAIFQEQNGKKTPQDGTRP